MVIFKKLIFAPFFLIVFALLVLNLAPILSSYDFIFSLSAATFIQLIIIAILAILSSFLFTVFMVLSQDWKLIIPVIILSSILTVVVIPSALAVIWSVIILVCLLLISIMLDKTLKKYLNFQPTKLFSPIIKQLSGLLILSFCLIYFLSTSQLISQQGFTIPDSLIDTALKMSPTSIPEEPSNPSVQVPSIDPDQIELLKKNTQLLQQYGLNPQMLDSLTNPSNLTQTPLTTVTNDLIKQTVKEQVDNLLKPYLGFIPIILALALFLTLKSLTSLISIFIPPLLWIIFLILEKTGFIHFEVTQRPVRKMVI